MCLPSRRIAAASGGPLQGALAMAAFALGTIPTLVAVALAGQLAARSLHLRLATAAPILLFANAALLAAAAWQALMRT